MPLPRHANNPRLASKISEMRLPLSPLVQITTGLVHPSFPKILLNYWLLTDSQLDDLAEFYHQRKVGRWTGEYPKTMMSGKGEDWEERWRSMKTEEKRRRWGRFMGLRGCESPKTERHALDWEEMMMTRVRKGREEEEMMRRKTQGYY